MTAEEALCYIHSAYRKGAAPGLSRITALLDALGNPQHSLKTIHIAEPTAKAAPAAMTAAVLKSRRLPHRTVHLPLPVPLFRADAD